MLRGGEQGRKRPGRALVRVEGGRVQGGLGAVVPVPLAPRPRRRGGGWAIRTLAATVLVGGVGWAVGNAMLQNAQATGNDCTALAIDRETGSTYAGPCVGTGPRLPSTLTALLPGALSPQAAAR